MHNPNIAKTEFRVREIKRYVVTRYDEGDSGRNGTSIEKGTYDNYEIAFEVAYALAQAETEKLGLAPDDARVQYPQKYDPRGMLGATINNVPVEVGAPNTTSTPIASATLSEGELGGLLLNQWQERVINRTEFEAVQKFLGRLADKRAQGELNL